MCAKPLEDRVAQKEAQLQKAVAKADRCKAQLKKLKSRQESQERKERTHKLIVCGAEIAALYSHTLELDEVLAVVDFLRRQKEVGNFTIEKPAAEVPKEPETKTEKTDATELFGGFFDF